MDTEEWQILDTHDTQKFIEAVKDTDFAPLFSGPAYELWIRELDFFDGYSHYCLINKAIIPGFTLDYISNGENHFYLDGSEHPLELLIRHGALRLNEDNVMAYIAFHNEVTFYPYRKVKFITDPKALPYAGASAMLHHFKTLWHREKVKLEKGGEEECFYIDMPLLYNGKTADGRVQVLETGEINVLKPVKIPLMDGKRDHAPLHYSHPYEKELLKQNIEVLCKSETGKRLYGTLMSYDVQIKIMSGVVRCGFAPNDHLGYVVAPQNIDTYSPYQLLDIAGTLRELELYVMDGGRGDPFGNADDFMTLNCSRNLDILLHMCKIAEELEKQEHPEVLQKFRTMGFEKIYSAYKNKRSHEVLLEVYADIMCIPTKKEQKNL